MDDRGDLQVFLERFCMGRMGLILSILVWGSLHSVFASLQFKALARRLLGPGVERVYRLGYNLFAGLSLLVVLVLAAFTADSNLYKVPLPWSVFMIAGEFLAGIALAVGFLQGHPFEFLGLSQLGSPIGERDKLTTTGLYRLVRHPLYTAGLLLIWLDPRMTVNLLVMDLALTAYILIGAHLEERKLRTEFGQEYEAYMAATPMFVPFLRGNKSRRGTS
jgi:protein-S-isoprenylcysteine O-methyltransferase Ste14